MNPTPTYTDGPWFTWQALSPYWNFIVLDMVLYAVCNGQLCYRWDPRTESWEEVESS